MLDIKREEFSNFAVNLVVAVFRDFCYSSSIWRNIESFKIFLIFPHVVFGLWKCPKSEVMWGTWVT